MALLLIILVTTSFSVIFSIGLRKESVDILSSSAIAKNSKGLFLYEWPQFMGDSFLTRASTGPAPFTANMVWKTNITGVQPYLSAFNGNIHTI